MNSLKWHRMPSNMHQLPTPK